MHAQIVVLQFPFKLSLKSRVSLLSLNETCFPKILPWLWDPPFYYWFLSSDYYANWAIQFPNEAIDLFMFFASYNLIDSEPVLFSLSDPAKSTIVNNAFL